MVDRLPIIVAVVAAQVMEGREETEVSNAMSLAEAVAVAITPFVPRLSPVAFTDLAWGLGVLANALHDQLRHEMVQALLPVAEQLALVGDMTSEQGARLVWSVRQLGEEDAAQSLQDTVSAVLLPLEGTFDPVQPPSHLIIPKIFCNGGS